MVTLEGRAHSVDGVSSPHTEGKITLTVSREDQVLTLVFIGTFEAYRTDMVVQLDLYGATFLLTPED